MRRLRHAEADRHLVEKARIGSAEFRNKVNFIDQASQVLGEIDRFYEPFAHRLAA